MRSFFLGGKGALVRGRALNGVNTVSMLRSVLPFFTIDYKNHAVKSKIKVRSYYELLMWHVATKGTHLA